MIGQGDAVRRAGTTFRRCGARTAAQAGRARPWGGHPRRRGARGFAAAGRSAADLVFLAGKKPVERISGLEVRGSSRGPASAKGVGLSGAKRARGDMLKTAFGFLVGTTAPKRGNRSRPRAARRSRGGASAQGRRNRRPPGARQTRRGGVPARRPAVSRSRGRRPAHGRSARRGGGEQVAGDQARKSPRGTPALRRGDTAGCACSRSTPSGDKRA